MIAPPPARTAAFSNERRPGVVLRVSHTRARPSGVHERAGQGRDAGQVAEEVERGPLGGEHRRQRASDVAQHRAGFNGRTFGHQPDTSMAVSPGERLVDTRPSCDDTRSPRHDSSIRRCTGWQQGRREVAKGCQVLADRKA